MKQAPYIIAVLSKSGKGRHVHMCTFGTVIRACTVLLNQFLILSTCMYEGYSSSVHVCFLILIIQMTFTKYTYSGTHVCEMEYIL